MEATLTVSNDSAYLCKLAFERRIPMDRAAGHEADIQAPQPEAGEQARIPLAHEDAGRAQGDQPTEKAGPEPDHGKDRGQVVEESPTRSERLPRSVRIRGASQIRGLLERGKRRKTASLDVFLEASPVSHSRFGLIVPKYGHRVVDRNLLKRRLREIGRRQILPRLAAGGVKVDVLIRARRRAYDAEFDSLAREAREAVEGLCSDES